MLFNSYVFIFAFLPLTLAGYFWLARAHSTALAKQALSLASLAFYTWLGQGWIFLLLASAGFNFLIAHAIQRRQHAKLWLLLGIAVDIGLLVYFKYRHEIVFGFNALFNSHAAVPPVVLPLAISFFSFHQIAYLVDVYQKRIDAETRFGEYVLFISFFPHLIAGPILYYRDIRPQLQDTQIASPQWQNLKTGAYLFALGLVKKTWIADTLGSWVDNGYAHSDTLNNGESVLLAYLFGLQLYFDFSAYCDMALGLARMFNIHFPLNFNSPYQARNLQEFWSRWHITLGKFFRDYVYIPLGGNRVSFIRQGLNLMVVMVLSGLWHGSNWLYFLWGVWHGIGMVLLQCWRQTGVRVPPILGQFLTVNFWVLSLVFFRSTHWDQAITLYSNLLHAWQGSWLVAKEHFISDSSAFFWLLMPADQKDITSSVLLYGSLIAGYVLCVCFPNAAQLAERSVQQRYFAFRLGALLTLGVLMITGYTPFIYFQF